MGVEDYITKERLITEERRDEWQCAEVLYAGDGPEHREWERILGVHPFYSWEAAQTYAQDHMHLQHPDYDYDGARMYVAVQTRPGHWLMYCCTKRIEPRIEARLDREREDLLP